VTSVFGPPCCGCGQSAATEIACSCGCGEISRLCACGKVLTPFGTPRCAQPICRYREDGCAASLRQQDVAGWIFTLDSEWVCPAHAQRRISEHGGVA